MRHSRSTRAAANSAVRCAPLTALLVLASLALHTSASAETILVGEQLAVRDSNVQHPAPGITMKEVEAQFGAPQERHPSVGEPPITRWDYAGFSVFFERDRVIHTVIAPAEAQASTATASAATASAPAAAEADASPTGPTTDAAAGRSDAEAPIEAGQPSAPATTTASASEPASAGSARLAPDAPVEAPPSSGADTHP